MTTVIVSGQSESQGSWYRTEDWTLHGGRLCVDNHRGLSRPEQPVHQGVGVQIQLCEIPAPSLPICPCYFSGCSFQPFHQKQEHEETHER